MANNKMLIDASHPEETRVVVLRGNRIEEFDFEAQERRQLRGNIYLAKVTRVEPSLQAAFIDYGGNRHGFLAFSEIHPDYYQIPAADRQALLAEEEEAAHEDMEADARLDEEEEEKPARKRKRRQSRKATTDENLAESQPDETAEEDGSSEPETSSDETEDEAEEKSAKDTKPKPARKRRRTSRAKKASEEDADTKDAGTNNDDGETPDSGSQTMAAVVETDSISEPAPEDESDEDFSDDVSEDDSPETAEAEKPKKRARKAPTRKKSQARKKVEDESVSEEAEKVETAEDAGTEDNSPEDNSEQDGEKPKKRSTRRKSRGSKAKKADEKDEEADINGDDASETAANGNGDAVESVAGEEDALEEVPVRRKPKRQYKIQEVIRRRQVLLVQVVKEERGNKGAALTTYLSLAGRYSVLMPNTARGGGISRKITNSGDRKRLKEIAAKLEVPKGMGVILRTAGASRTNAEITRDFEYLMRLWENVRNLTLASSAPYLVYEEGSLIKRSIRDLYHKDINEIIVSGDEGYREAKDFMKMLMPSHAKNVKQHKSEQPILSKYGVEAQLDKMLAPQVTLKSGGYLVINQTEALVAIDVNSGRSTREHSIEATALQTNLEAAEEVARQLRLRDLAGLVVIDFIDMEEKRNNRSVEKKLKECLKHDRARIQVGHISHFGLLEMSRQRMRASVLESTMAICPHCQGLGHVRSQSSFAIQVVRAVEEHLNRHSRNDVTIKLRPSSAMYLLNYKRTALNDLEIRYGVDVIVEGDTNLEGQNFVIEKGAPSTGEAKPRAVVNPMDFGDEDENDNTEDAEENGSDTAGENEDERGGKKRRRRRRGGRGKNRERNAGEESEPGTGSADSNNEADAVDTEQDLEKPQPSDEQIEASTEKPKRRKTGRTTQKIPKSATESIEEENPQNGASGTGNASEASDASDTEDAPARKRRATGRPGKKVKTEDNGATQSNEVAEKPQEEAKAKPETDTPEDPPRPKRRNTRRVKAEKKDNDATSESVEEPAKKKSWWGKGGFFG